MWGWIAVVVLGWLCVAVVTIALLTMAKWADAAAEASRARVAGGSSGPLAGRLPEAVGRPSAQALEGLARAVRQQLAVEEVLIVERAPADVVVVAVAGLPAGLLGQRLGPRDSLAAAIALSRHAVIAPDHGSLTRPGAPAAGDAAAVPLSHPVGAIAVARAGRLTSDDLSQLRVLVGRHELATRAQRHTPPARDRAERRSAARTPDGEGVATASAPARPAGNRSPMERRVC